MIKCLLFSSGGHDFLLSTDKITEVYDAEASPERFEDVLVGKRDEAYWRGEYALLVDINEALDLGRADGRRYIVCEIKHEKAGLLILCVDQIHSLIDVDERSFHQLDINNPKLKAMVKDICILDGSEKMGLVVQQPEDVINASLF